MNMFPQLLFFDFAAGAACPKKRVRFIPDKVNKNKVLAFQAKQRC